MQPIPPHVVVVMTDQQRWDAFGAAGNDRIRTPNLDRLAGEGVRFERAFVPIPLCTPSRASLFTGRYPNGQTMGGNERATLPPEAPNLAGAFRDAGYRTLLVGKDHLFGPAGSARFFDHAVRYDHAGRLPVDGGDDAERAVRASRIDRFSDRFVASAEHDAAHQPTRRLTGEAIAAVRDARARRQPFFLWLSYPDPHPPYVVAEPYASLYRGQDLGTPATRPDELNDKPLRQRLARDLMGMGDYQPADLPRLREIYYGMVTFIDDEVGRFATALEAEGIADDTILLFLSDHGDYLGDHGMVRKSPAMYDCLVRVPLFVRWPAQIRPGRVTDTLVESIDLASTLLDLAGLPPLPGDAGRSLAPLLRGETGTHKERVFGLYGGGGDAFTEVGVERLDLDALRSRPHPWMGTATMRGRMAMVRTTDWKLVHHRGGEGELYDLRRDPDELWNRYRDPVHAEARAELTRALADFLLDALPDPPAAAAPDRT